MTHLLSLIRSFWDALPVILTAMAVAFCAGVWVQARHSKVRMDAQISALGLQHSQQLLESAQMRERDRDEFVERLNKQREESNEKYSSAVHRHSIFVADLERMRSEQSTQAMYMRATAESAAARAATAERLLGECGREYYEMARRARVHTLDLQDALTR